MKVHQFSHRPASINTLPVELLTRIFVLGAGYDYLYEDSPFLLKPNQDIYPPPSSFQTLASHVCHRWRQIAIRTPSLWKTIHLREPVHIPRAKAYLERCSASSNYLLDILVDTVAQEEHIPGVTLCREEINAIFELIIPHVAHWRSFHLKVRDNECKLSARHYLGSCGPAPRLETLQLYHFEDYRTAQNLYLATYRPPVVVFSNSLPRLRNVSLIGVNLPWTRSPYLVNLEKLELALHPDNIRPSYECWDHILRNSPNLQSLNLHYSGPRVDTGEDKLAWHETSNKIILEHLTDLGLTDLDPDYLCDLMERLHLPNVKKITWDLCDQDYTTFIDLVTRKTEVTVMATPPATPPIGSDSRSKMSVSSLLSDTVLDRQVVSPSPTTMSIYTGPLPNISKLETVVISALDCSLRSWKSLLGALEGLKRLEVDFSRLGPGFWSVLTGESEGGVKTMHTSKPLLVPKLEVIKVSGLPGTEIEREIKRRAVQSCLRHWIVRWSTAMKGEDSILDALAQNGCWVSEEGYTKVAEADQRVYVIVETFAEGDEEDDDDEGEDLEEDVETPADSGSDEAGSDSDLPSTPSPSSVQTHIIVPNSI
ncbi:hypothetical protein CC1G_07175 [Coprinopsis cinerea okayama7|uniref:F-box domain-containing protein n=1 Tax=Coprinopsis cinerea (strain Okayama-7 / 130 / ATCC MYA-4618 / FGSC 9003) TaxID=240176 RepID=A8NRC5_COPC7|nr:hypothetical protein CC1G_07175 [Coprinopsis cinerea okayama7\|eukprot:XP_001835751.1 hypothetical protein CC1G_07175 [Coprinopsis cinerea okayama7\